MDYYAVHRMTDDRHIRIYDNGKEEEFPVSGVFRVKSRDLEKTKNWKKCIICIIVE